MESREGSFAKDMSDEVVFANVKRPTTITNYVVDFSENHSCITSFEHQHNLVRLVDVIFNPSLWLRK